MHMHGGNEAGIVHLDAGDAVSDEELSPFDVNIGRVEEQDDPGFD